MQTIPLPLQKLIQSFSQLPGIGEKTATRLSYFLLKQRASFAKEFATAIEQAHQNIHFCENCFGFCLQSPCDICRDTRRKKNILCVIENPSDLYFIEDTNVHKGLYHVLHGLLSPLDGIGPESLQIESLIKRVQKNPIEEILFAFNSSPESETTMLYLTRLLQPYAIKTTKLARGVPSGGLLEYTDTRTLAEAIDHRVEITL